MAGSPASALDQCHADQFHAENNFVIKINQKSKSIAASSIVVCLLLLLVKLSKFVTFTIANW